MLGAAAARWLSSAGVSGGDFGRGEESSPWWNMAGTETWTHTHGAAGSPLLLAVLSASTRRQAEGNGAEVTLHLRRGANRQARATSSSVGTA